MHFVDFLFRHANAASRVDFKIRFWEGIEMQIKVQISVTPSSANILKRFSASQSMHALALALLPYLFLPCVRKGQDISDVHLSHPDVILSSDQKVFIRLGATLVI